MAEPDTWLGLVIAMIEGLVITQLPVKTILIATPKENTPVRPRCLALLCTTFLKVWQLY